MISALVGSFADLDLAEECAAGIAVAEADGVEAGLALVDWLDLDGSQYFHSTRADLLRRLGRASEEHRIRARPPARARRARAPLPAAARR